MVIKHQFLALDRNFFGFDKNRFRQDDILLWQGEPHVSKRQIYDGEKHVLFEPNQGVRVNLGHREPKYTLSLASWVDLSGVPFNPTDG